MISCYILDDDLLQCAVLVDHIARTEGLEIVGASQEPLSAIKFFAKQGENIDLLFLDVEMPVLNGLEFLDSISYNGQVVLVTSNPNYAVESYSYEILDFLLKPVAYERFLISISKFKKLLEPKRVELYNTFYLKVNGSLKKFLSSEILYCKGADDYVEIFTKTKKYLASTTLTKLEEKLPNSVFMRVHRSTIVNLRCIDEVDQSGIVINQEYLAISASYKKVFFKRIDIV